VCIKHVALNGHNKSNRNWYPNKIVKHPTLCTSGNPELLIQSLDRRREKTTRASEMPLKWRRTLMRDGHSEGVIHVFAPLCMWAHTVFLLTIYKVRTVMENLEKSWNFKMVISRPVKVTEKTQIIKVLEKSWEFVIITCSFTQSLK